MKLLGHAWVAVKAVPNGKRSLLIFGSILPEIMYYTNNNSFEFDEVHEGGEEMFGYLKARKPEWQDLGLGMVTHSVRYGADHFNLDENLAILGYKGRRIKELRENISSVLNVSYETAKVRAHNILELAVEVNLIRNYSHFVVEFNQVLADDHIKEQTVNILSSCFNKPKDRVALDLTELLNKAKPEYFDNAKGLAQLWRELSRALRDPKFDIEQLTELLENLAESFNGREQRYLSECIRWTSLNIKEIIS